jgi:hypothetical protein
LLEPSQHEVRRAEISFNISRKAVCRLILAAIFLLSIFLLRQHRGKSSYGLYVDSEPESDGYNTLDEESDTDSIGSPAPSDSYLRLSNLGVGRSEQKTSRRPTTDAEMRYIEDTIAAIRLRTRHQDPYEKWEQETPKDAFVRSQTGT